jgi:SAM-dependent methyltransferase
MTALPPPTFSAAQSHNARHVAESFGTEAERYDRTRPRYPKDLVKVILAAVPGPDVLDVGIGTGVSARPFTDAGCRILGIEPDERMGQFARRNGFDVEVAKFEEWDPRGRTFDAVVAGQSWHWVDPLVGATRAAQVLRPSGCLAVFWNVFLPPQDLAAAFADVYRATVPDLPFSSGTLPGLEGYSQFFSKAEDGIRRAGTFSEPREERFDWQQAYSKDEWLDQVPTFGGHSLIPPDRMEKLLQGIGSEIDAVGGSFVMDYAAVVVMGTLTESRA